MTETRRLDVLAVVGGVLGIALVLYLLYQRGGGCPDLAKWRSQSDNQKIRTAIFKQLPESEMKADLAVIFGVRKTAGEYSNSARVQFRLGTRNHDDKALRRAAELDKDNALPLYYLASKAASMDGTLALLREAGRRKGITDYPLSLKGKFERMAYEISLSVAFPKYLVLRHISKDVSEYALKLHQQGRTDEALEAIRQVKAMGWNIIRDENPTILGVLVGTAVIHDAEKPERQIYTGLGSKTGLAELEREKARLDYLRTGARYCVTHANERMVKGVNRNMAILLPVTYMSIAQLIILLACGICWATLLLESRRQPASEVHEEATKSFSIARLARLYLLIFVPAIAICAIIYTHGKNDVPPLTPIYVLGAIFPLILLMAANIIYRRSAGVASWRSASVHDKREVQRRMMGVAGGAVVLLSILGLLIAGGTRVATGLYPWETHSYATRMCGQEAGYVKQLLAGKIKLPVNSEK